jgi:hypothetical protein
MQEQELATLKGIAATLDYMASAERLDVKYTKDALGVLAEQLYEVIDQCEQIDV